MIIGCVQPTKTTITVILGFKRKEALGLKPSSLKLLDHESKVVEKVNEQAEGQLKRRNVKQGPSTLACAPTKPAEAEVREAAEGQNTGTVVGLHAAVVISLSGPGTLSCQHHMGN